jgi:hypothetical protein
MSSSTPHDKGVAAPKPRTATEGPVTLERFQSATAAIRRVLEGSACLEDWESAFSQVLALSGRAANSETVESAALIAARDEYRTVLTEWHRQLPRLRGWLAAEKNRLESRLAHGTGVQSWLGTHSQTR